MSHNAANINSTSDAGIGQNNVLDSGTRSRTENTLIAGGDHIDADAADGMALTVEGAFESIIVTDGGIVILFAGGIVPGGGVVVGDVSTQTEVLTTEIVAAVHQRG